MTLEPITASKAAGAAAGVASLAAAGQTVLGMQADVFLVAAAGALFGLAYTDPKLWARWLAVPAGTWSYRLAWLCLRAGGLAFTLLANAVIASWVTQALPHVPAFAWTASIPPQALGGLLAFASQRLIPKALARGERILDGKGAAE